MASLVAAMLDEGAGTRSALELADAVEFLGAELATGSSFDHSAVRLSAPVKNLSPALTLLADVVLRPTFPTGELDRLKKERLAALVQAQDNPAAVIGYAFPRVVFGPTHRFGTPATGLAPAIESITADEGRAFYKEHYVSGNAAIVVTGEVTLAAVKAELDKAFGRRGAIADPDRLGGRAAIDAGLRDAAGAEHDPGGLVRFEAEPEPARAQRLHLRRCIGVRHAQRGRPVLRERGCADRQDGRCAP
jgi:zinc protease